MAASGRLVVYIKRQAAELAHRLATLSSIGDTLAALDQAHALGQADGPQLQALQQ